MEKFMIIGERIYCILFLIRKVLVERDLVLILKRVKE